MWITLLITTFVLLGTADACFAQWKFDRTHGILVTESGDTLLDPWSGGLNNPQFSSLDINNDGMEDLFIFERDGDLVRPYLKQVDGTFRYSAAHVDSFPRLQSFALLRDFDCDGKADIFTAALGIAGFRIFKANSGIDRYTIYNQVLQTDYGTATIRTLLHVPTDLPAIDDIDGDGDLDILTFGTGSSLVEFHRNLAQEMYQRCDTMAMQMFTNCWGTFAENALDNSILLGTCSPLIGKPHAGSSLLTYDRDGDGDKELILGDVSFRDLVHLENGGDSINANMIEWSASFPSYSQPAQVNLFPAAFTLDHDADGLDDLLVAPNITNISENASGIWKYKNTGKADSAAFSLETANFLVEDMLDFGSGANLASADIDADGLQDLIVGNSTLIDSNGNSKSQLALLLNRTIGNDIHFELVSKDWLSLSSANLFDLYPTFADIDNDNDDDLFLGESNGKVLFYENIGSRPNPNFVLKNSSYMGIDIGNNSNPFFWDLDKDGILDLIVGERSGNINYFQNTGTISNAQFSSTPTNAKLGGIDTQIPCCTGFSTVNIVTQNNKDYLFVGSETGQITIYDSISDPTNNFNLIDSLVSSNRRTSPLVFDFNGDSRPDLMVGAYTGGINSFVNSFGLGFDKLTIGKLKVKPNPSSGIFFIDIPNELSIADDLKLSVINLLGVEVKSIVNPRDQLRLRMDRLPSGVYQILLLSNTRLAYQSKIILTRN